MGKAERVQQALESVYHYRPVGRADVPSAAYCGVWVDWQQQTDANDTTYMNTCLVCLEKQYPDQSI
jgi:hypothetical protein